MKLRLGLLVTLVALLGGPACKKAPEPTAQPLPAPAADPWAGAVRAKDPLQRPSLWRGKKDGIPTSLLGTMHVGVDPETRLPQLVWDKLDAAPSFAVETDVTDPAIASIGGRA